MRLASLLVVFVAGCGGGRVLIDRAAPPVQEPVVDPTNTDDGEDPVPNPDPDPDPDNGDPHQYCVDTINSYRATLDLPPLARWTAAESCSDQEAADDAASGVPHGAFGACNEFAQNECPDWSAPLSGLLDGCLALMWAEGPGEDFAVHGHYINMSSTDYTEVACGFSATTGDGIWAVQNFR